ncbi:uncharacterized protein UV8b_06626 [Ustilaginoidea virens]|uniref:Uncharacterized protein n=1 Tax=Ustilaginoidea virens TaxID=1159556 RepID=A0A063C8J9_USTVR|nr:uncharacterized protein UV8b_06626 [Ustilaginoidea virens]QUC22385.1 hypothetical protein UV8b_06626 [Ustilaginoidea virens]GAO18516.1 hypothetical protein UVI_02054580 [Ustilaginoidea virens]
MDELLQCDLLQQVLAETQGDPPPRPPSPEHKNKPSNQPGPVAPFSFSGLPPEIRLSIWEEVFAGWSVWAVTSHGAREPEPLLYGPPNRPFLTVTPVGHAPALCGLVCREAREQLAKSYGSPLRALSFAAKDSGVYWVNMDRAVLYLGNATNAAGVLDGFAPEELAKVQHVVLLWDNASPAPVCPQLAASCPDLKTIVVQRLEGPGASAAARKYPQPPPASMAPACLSLVRSSGKQSTLMQLYAHYFGSQVLVHFAKPRPRLLVLSIDVAS